MGASAAAARLSLECLDRFGDQRRDPRRNRKRDRMHAQRGSTLIVIDLPEALAMQRVKK